MTTAFFATDAGAYFVQHRLSKLLLDPDFPDIRGSIRSNANDAYAARYSDPALRIVPLALERTS